MIGEAAVEAHRCLRHEAQPFLVRGNRDAGVGVDMHHGVDIGPRPEHRGVDGEARRVHRDVGFDRTAVQVDLDQAGCGDLAEHPLVRLDQKMVGLARHPAGEVVVDQLGPAELLGQAVGGRKIHPRAPLGLGDRTVTRRR